MLNKKQIVVALTLLTVMFSAPALFAQGTPRTAAEFINRAVKKGSSAEALANLNKAIELEPNNAAAYKYRGNLHMDYGRTEQAEADFAQALRLNPNDWEVYSLRAFAYGNRGQWDKAIDDYTQAIKLKSNDFSLYLARGRMYQQSRNYTQAIADFTRAIEIAPQEGEAYYYRSQIYKTELKEYSKARADLEMAVKYSAWGYKPNGQVYYEYAFAKDDLAALKKQGY